MTEQGGFEGAVRNLIIIAFLLGALTGGGLCGAAFLLLSVLWK